MGLRLKFNIVLAGIVLIGLLACSTVIFYLIDKDARQQLHEQIDVIRAHALSVRRYTSEEVRPLLADAAEVQFLPQTVPSFAARAAFSNFSEKFPQFSYREAALNPTNPADRADRWEEEVIKKLRDDRSLKQIAEIRSAPSGDRYTVAYPLVISSRTCLTCHSDPKMAPPSMIEVYGDKNGFGWRMNEVVGVQIISAPLQIAEARVWQALKLVGAAVAIVFVVTMLVLNLLLSRMLITPVKKMSRIAHAVSMGDNSQPEYILSGSDELSSLSQSFSRMRRSLDNAMKMLEQ